MGMKTPVTRLDYCQYLLVSQINYTLTNFADHCEQFSHDTINRYLRGERITPRLVWDNVRGQLALTPQGFVIFDDTVLDKNSSFAIELVRRQYSGNAQRRRQRDRRSDVRLRQSRHRPVLVD